MSNNDLDVAIAVADYLRMSNNDLDVAIAVADYLRMSNNDMYVAIAVADYLRTSNIVLRPPKRLQGLPPSVHPVCMLARMVVVGGGFLSTYVLSEKAYVGGRCRLAVVAFFALMPDER
ncbi:hypothetical protein ACFFSY_09030 [Paenibacillus aurantiacus]|uniref:Uncharacterized protein n=1 Tax=Paenibacillus aurantiacus TaxID=1936118 RepID=A0ABV5KN52_9BACL